jgi:hypothetical protein
MKEQEERTARRRVPVSGEREGERERERDLTETLRSGTTVQNELSLPVKALPQERER